MAEFIDMGHLQTEEVGWSLLSQADSNIYHRAFAGAMTDESGADRLTWDRHYGLCVNEKESYYHEIVLCQIVERVPDLIKLWHDLYRICAPGATVHINGIYWTHVDAQADPTICRGISERMFAYVSAIGREDLARDEYEDRYAIQLLHGVDFDVREIKHFAEPEWEGKSDEAKMWGIRHFQNVVRRISVRLECIKPSRDKNGTTERTNP